MLKYACFIQNVLICHFPKNPAISCIFVKHLCLETEYDFHCYCQSMDRLWEDGLKNQYWIQIIGCCLQIINYSLKLLSRKNIVF